MTQFTEVRRRLVILSPLGLVATCHLVERAAGPTLGVWAWVPAMMVFWATIAALILWTAGRHALGCWLQPPQGGWAWSVLAVAVGLLSLREFLADWHVLESATVFSLWLAFGLLNPWFEESYWRGLLIDATAGWVAGLGVVYSTLLFALSHPLIWGVHSVALRHPAVLVGLVLVGAVWSVAYRRTGSLRYAIAGHALANLLGLSVPTLLNLHVPAALR
jgi:membrane protease YdiL (CAAX protease family)